MFILLILLSILGLFTTTQAIASRNERRALESAMDAIRKEENERFIKLLEAI